MFKKLKKKLEEETNADIAPGLPLASSGSSISLSGSERETSPVKISSSQETLSTIPNVSVNANANANANDAVKKASTNSDQDHNGPNDKLSLALSPNLAIDALTLQLKQKSDRVSTLENTIKDLQQQLLGEQKRNAKLASDSDQLKEKRSKKEREMVIQFENLNREKMDLEVRLRDALLKSERLAAQQESTEELDGFQSQEMAKVKHLLLKSQQDLSQKQEEAKRHWNDLLLANQKVRELEAELQKSKEGISSVKSLQLEKRHLESEVDRLKQDALKNATRSSHMEKTLGDLTDELDALKHIHEVYKSKNSSLLDEKDNEICHIQERVEVLEKRLAESDLSGDEKVEALIAERKTMEKKLEESRQHLSEVKTTWSEKIHSLENQIFHLNKKMAEDSEDSGQFEKRLEEAQGQMAALRESNFKLEEQLNKMKERNQRLEKEKNEAIQDLEERLSKRETELGTKATQLEAQLTEIRKSTTKEISELQNRVSELVSCQTENVQKEIETEQKLTNLEDENMQLKSDLNREETEKISITEAYASTVARLQEAEKKISQLESECSNYALEVQNVTSLLQSEQRMSEERRSVLDRLMIRNAELSQQLELLKREADEESNIKEKEKEELERQVSQLEERNSELQEKVDALEKGESERQAQNGLNEVQNSTILELQEKLADRNKTIKLQQQRLGDMKKTLQRELKVQTNFDSNQSLLESSAAIIPTTNISTPDSKRSQRRSASPNGLGSTNGSGSILSEGTPYDDVNFSYLRHVVFKFMTSPEYEAQHLVRAVAVLLHLTQEEEKFIKDILEWKMSWFGSKPQPGSRYYKSKPTQAPLLLSKPR